MSQAKIDRKLHAKFIAQTDEQIRSGITKILRRKFRNNSSAVKVICRDTGAALRAARNWYDGENSPSLLHFVLLARNYPELVDLFLNLCQQRPDKSPVRGTKQSLEGTQDPEGIKPKLPPKTADHVGNNVGNRESAEACNSRQLWFMLRLQEGATATAESLASCWRVSVRTAERDITQLRQLGLVAYQGSKRAGHYSLIQPPGLGP